MAEDPEDINPVKLQRYLGGIDYPVSKEDLVRTAHEQDAPENVVRILRAIRPGTYNSPIDVTREAGQYT